MGPSAVKLMRRTLAPFRGYSLKRSGACFGYCMILLAGASTNADRACNLSVTLQRDSPGENHDSSGIGHVDPEELATGLGVLR